MTNEKGGRFGPFHEYRTEGDDETYLLSGVDPSNSVLLAEPLTTRFTHDAGTYGWWTWLKYNVSALLVAIQFWVLFFFKRPKDGMAAKKLLNACWPVWYPKHWMAKQIRQGTQGTAALVPIYDREAIFFGLDSLSADEGAFLVEYGQPEALDVTSRLFATAQAVYEYFIRCINLGQAYIRVCSIASGSSRGVLDAAYRARQYCWDEGIAVPTFEFRFVDLDSEALRSSGDSAELRGFKNVTLYQMGASEFFESMKLLGFTFDVIEMVGLVDYLNDKKAVKYHEACRKLLVPGGMYVTAHINKTKWAFSVKYRTGWPGLRRRTPETLRRHLIEAGFIFYQITLETMPACRAHTVAVVVCPRDPIASS